MIVGDDDQLIYGWCGVQVENIQCFFNDFFGVQIICLEQNYCLISNIFSVVNVLIENNNGCLGKKLWIDGVDGELIFLYCVFNELDEVCFVVNCIKIWQDNGGVFV